MTSSYLYNGNAYTYIRQHLNIDSDSWIRFFSVSWESFRTIKSDKDGQTFAESNVKAYL